MEMIAPRVIRRKIIHVSFFLKMTFPKYQLFSNISKAYVHKPYFKVDWLVKPYYKRALHLSFLVLSYIPHIPLIFRRSLLLILLSSPLSFYSHTLTAPSAKTRNTLPYAHSMYGHVGRWAEVNWCHSEISFNRWLSNFYRNGGSAPGHSAKELTNRIVTLRFLFFFGSSLFAAIPCFPQNSLLPSPNVGSVYLS